MNNTLAWWGKQSQEIQDEAFGEDNERVTMDSLTKQLNKWCVGLDYIWCPEPHLILLFCKTCTKIRQASIGTIGKLRDSRTLFKMLPQRSQERNTNRRHNALADCYYLAKCVQKHTNILE